jgi:aldose 1-epimerase
VGRVANRISNAAFDLEGKTYKLAKNHGKHHIHGGELGLHRVIWDILEKTDSKVTFSYHSPDGEEGYPGNLDLKVSYSLSDEKGLEIHYDAQTDQRTPLNLTNHSYFNLNGAGNENIENHIFQIHASSFLPTDKEQIPTGEVREVDRTPFDLRVPKTIGPLLSEKDEQIKVGNGFDHHFITDGDGLRLQAEATSPLTGIKMEVWSDQPGLQFFCGGAMKNPLKGKEGKIYGSRVAFCMETQGYPNALNNAGFPDIITVPEAKYHRHTAYKFKAH